MSAGDFPSHANNVAGLSACGSVPNRQGSFSLNRMVISGIKALMLSLGVVASLRAAEPAAGDDVSAGPSLTLLPLPPNPEGAVGGQDVPSPPVPATGGGLGGGASQVPSAVPLPNAQPPQPRRVHRQRHPWQPSDRHRPHKSQHDRRRSRPRPGRRVMCDLKRSSSIATA